MKSDSPLKKHHFWILLGLVPLFTLIGVLIVSSSVGGAITDGEKAINDANSGIGSKQNPKPKSVIEEAKKLVAVVSSKQGNLHKANWEKQKYLFTWPRTSRLLQEIEQRNPKFGDPLPTERGEFDEFRKNEVYLNEFSSLRGKDAVGPGTGMADRIAPTQFKGGWANVLRHVTDFGASQITKDQVWLIMEDIWVQRSLMEAVRSVNDEMAAFHRAKRDKDGNIVEDPGFDDWGNKIGKDRNGRSIIVPTPDDEKNKVLFRSRTWGIELELVREGTSQRLTGKLTNLSERLQLLGVGNVMTLHVWFTHDPAEQPTVFKIGNEFLPGKGATKTKRVDGGEKTVPANELDIVRLDDHVLPLGKRAEEIVRVQQVFDIRTVPIKRIDALVLGKSDSRNVAKPLVTPTFIKIEPPPDTGGSTPPAPGPNMGSMSGPPGGIQKDGPRGPNGMGTQQEVGIEQGGGPIAAVIDANNKRYVVANEQVRRMPIGIALVVDQDYMQDALLSFANSPLRFQITQIEWTRFHDTLDGIGSSGATNESGGIVGGKGTVNFGSMGGPPGLGGPKPFRPSVGVGPGPLGMPPSAPPSPYGPGGFGPGGPYGSTGSSVSDAQITSGLVELHIYGVVSLYEKYTEPKQEDATSTTTPNTTTPNTTPPNTTPTPAPGPMPTAPMNTPPMNTPPANTPPKMRRRTRK